jgi:hypothetical protein
MSDSVTLKKRLAYYKRCIQNGDKYELDRNALSRAAQFFHLDPAGDREALLVIMADALFGKRNGHPWGTASSWPESRLKWLGAAYRKTKSENPQLTDEKIAIIMVDRFDELKAYAPSTVQRVFSWCRKYT